MGEVLMPHRGGVENLDDELTQQGAMIEELKLILIPVTARKELNENSWEVIAIMNKLGLASEYWPIGSIKTINMGDDAYDFRLIGYNSDTVADDLAYGSAKAHMTFELVDCYKAKYQMNEERENAYGWVDSDIRNVHLPAIKALLPEELREMIVPVKKTTSIGDEYTDLVETVDDLFLLSESEVYGGTTNSVEGEGEQYAYYASGNSKIKNLDGVASTWWERSPNKNNGSTYCIVNSDGSAGINTANLTSGLSFAFCI